MSTFPSKTNGAGILTEVDRVLGTSGIVRSVSFERSWVYVLFIESCISKGLVFHHDYQWATGEASFDQVIDTIPGFAVYAENRWNGKTLAIFGEDLGVLLHLRDQRLSITVARPQKTVVPEGLVATLKELLPPARPNSKNIIPFTFWAASKDGANAIGRDIAVPTWQEIERNYPSTTRQALDRAMREFTPSSGGQLILFYGDPGVGKTYAIRSLSSAWSDWCKFEYVMDPEEFLGNSSYMMEVLTHGEDHDDDHGQKEEPKWRALILEDAGELLSADAKERTGQGLSRMLNITDGLIGQGLQILVLITTNEPVRRANPAVARPGRSAIEIQFESFGKAEGEAWLLDRGMASPVVSARSVTLAELYNLLDDRRIIARHETKVGLIRGR